MADVFYIKRGDTLPSLSAALKDADGQALNLTGATVQMVMRERGSNAAKLTRACTIVSAASGTVRFDWQSTDTDDIGTFDVEFRADFAGQVMTVPSLGAVSVAVTERLS